MNIGDVVGRGRTSDVFAYGSDSVIKVPHENVPHSWAGFEAMLTRAVHDAGVPVPQVREVVEHQGRDAVVFERIDGPSMWQQMLDAPDRAGSLAVDLAAIHRSLLTIGIPAGLPDLSDRMQRKIAATEQLPLAERDEATSLMADLPHGAALLHGDLHPGNILMSPQGPIIIDWFDAAIGHPVADIVRTSILIRPSAIAAPTHLPSATPDMLSQVHDHYLGEFSADLLRSADDLARWQSVVAAGRLSERADADELALMRLWQGRYDGLSAGGIGQILGSEPVT